MVEGPKVLLKVERLQSIIGQRFIDYVADDSNPETQRIRNTFKNEVIISIDCIGKELFVHFTNSCHCGYVIRLHFGMSGSEMIVSREYHEASSESSINSNKHSRKVKTCAFILADYILDVFDSNIQLKTTTYYTKILSYRCRDIMSHEFKCENVIDCLRCDISPISDAIMDQTIFPGVGNIIKCEGLFETALNPNTLSNTIPLPILQRLVENLRSFALKWYQSSRSHRSMSYKVYGRQECSKCNRNIKLVRHGKYDRITYYCERCQPISILSTPSGVINENLISNSVEYDELRSADDVIDNVDFHNLTPHLCHCRKTAALNRVRKDSENKNRLFWSCATSLKSSKRCGYFEWADGSFPLCNHRERAILRRVLRDCGNNGRYFYCCRRTMSDGCKFFQWVNRVETSHPIERLTVIDSTSESVDQTRYGGSRPLNDQVLGKRRRDSTENQTYVRVPL